MGKLSSKSAVKVRRFAQMQSLRDRDVGMLETLESKYSTLRKSKKFKWGRPPTPDTPNQPEATYSHQKYNPPYFRPRYSIATSSTSHHQHHQPCRPDSPHALCAHNSPAHSHPHQQSPLLPAKDLTPTLHAPLHPPPAATSSPSATTDTSEPPIPAACAPARLLPR